MKIRMKVAVLLLTVPVVGAATTLPLDGVMKTAGLQLVGESKYPWSKGQINFKAAGGLTCTGSYEQPSLKGISEGAVECSDGRTGRFILHSKNPHIKGWAEGAMSDGEEFQFDIGESIVHGKFEKYLRQDQTYQYVGETEIDGLIVDPQGTSPAKYRDDVAACRRFREQAEGSVVGDAIGGAIVGSAVASLAGDKYSRTDAAKVGAVVSAADGASQSADEQDNVLRNCLVGRGYRVLN